MENSRTGQEELQRPLDGIRIVEYGVFHAGPGGNAILGDLGAEVIKIENAAGDPERYWTNVAGLNLALNNGYLVPFEHPVQGAIKIPGYPVHFSACDAGTKSAAPRFGEHTDSVMQELGYSIQDIEQFRKDHVIS